MTSRREWRRPEIRTSSERRQVVVVAVGTILWAAAVVVLSLCIGCASAPRACEPVPCEPVTIPVPVPCVAPDPVPPLVLEWAPPEALSCEEQILALERALEQCLQHEALSEAYQRAVQGGPQHR